MSLSVSMHIWSSEDNAPVHCFHEVDPRDQVVKKKVYIYHSGILANRQIYFKMRWPLWQEEARDSGVPQRKRKQWPGPTQAEYQRLLSRTLGQMSFNHQLISVPQATFP